LVEDSIVRGTTIGQTVKSLKIAGANEVHLRVSSPPCRHMCYYGTDIDKEENLLANQLSLDGICRKIGADSLGYLSIDGLKKACSQCALPFCADCYTGSNE
jgi:amidophosphoribosyltransferase